MANAFCYIHIGKTGGTNLKRTLKMHMKRHPEVEFGLSSHKETLASLARTDPNSTFFFFVREPIKRYISAFNSRLRMGQPRYNVPWTKGEEKVFRRFETPRALAEALSAPSWFERYAARKALATIRHTKRAYAHYLGSVQQLEKLKDRIVMIGLVESYDEDFEWLKHVLDIDPDINPSDDAVDSHKSPESVDTSMSELGARNLRAYYAKDYTIYEWCLARRLVLKANLP